MNINDIKIRLFAIDSLCEGTSAEKKQGKRLIKGLSQEERALVLEILQNPNVKVSKEKRVQLSQSLSQEIDRPKSFRLKWVRGWKNAYDGRIKTATLFESISKSKIDYENELEKQTAAKRSKADKNYQKHLVIVRQLVSHHEIENRLDSFSKEPRENDLMDFMNAHAKELSYYAFKNPQKWSIFSQKMIIKIEERITKYRRSSWLVEKLTGIKKLFERLDLIHSPSVVGMQKFSLVEGEVLPKEIVHLIATKLPSDQKSLKLLQLLYRGYQTPAQSVLRSVNSEGFAKYMTENQIPLPEVNLSFQDLKKVGNWLPEIDLSSIGIKGKLSIKHTKKLKVSHSIDLKYIGIFKNLEELSLKEFQNFKDANKYLKLNHLKSLTLVNCSAGSQSCHEWIKSLPHLKKLSIYIFHGDVSNYKFPISTTELNIWHCNNFSLAEPEKLLQITSLAVMFSSITTENLQIIGKLPLLDSFQCSELPVKGIEFLSNIRTLKIQESISKENLMGIGKLFRLEELILYRRNLSKEEVSFLTASLPNIRQIYTPADGYVVWNGKVKLPKV